MPFSVAAGVVNAAVNRARILAEIEREGLRVVARGDTEYPGRLLAIEMPPPALFVRGTLAPLACDHVVGVVGTRRPSPAGRRIASRIGTALARAEATVVSGLAVGIDGAAHAAAVAEQRPTVAFIGGGHGRLFPRAHDRLADAIVEGGGAVVSEYAPMVEPSKGTFPQRNRLISGTSDAVVVVEAGATSGALLTASWALEQGRECFLVPGSIDSPTSAGCNGFLREWPGAARVVSGIPQLLDDLGLFAGAALGGTPDRPDGARSGGVVISARIELPTVQSVLSGRSPSEQDVGEALVHGAVTVDELVAVTRHPLADVLSALTRLETSGLAHATHGRYEPLGALAGSNPSRRSKSKAA
jgi:DNA processing protein